MKARLVRIGNSRGIRLPKPLIEEAGRPMRSSFACMRASSLFARQRARAGWAKAAKLMRSRNDDRLLDPPVATGFDEDEWEW